ncbi:hypothetical protein MRB53_016368 [Persea americana]|uniref:Uncharacterized protein n=1 Tax=Persea americana TaxID=3435 RepID=A0ACC2M2X7_PERAE|nr:hypothetical protein MRB53_016368 [Persea americana]
MLQQGAGSDLESLQPHLTSDNMTNKWHVYMTKDGRISLAGLSLAKCEYLADAIIDSYHNQYKGLKVRLLLPLNWVDNWI